MATMTHLLDRVPEAATIPAAAPADDRADLDHRRTLNAQEQAQAQARETRAALTVGVPADQRTARGCFEYPLLARTWGQVPFTRI